MGSNKHCSVIFISLLLLILFACLVVLRADGRLTNITMDKDALLALKAHITHDPLNLLASNWSSSSSVCDWVGIRCGVRHPRVTAIKLSNMGLIGTIPPLIGNLSFLISLSFHNNSFHGTLPNQLTNLRRLKILILSRNHFSGEIPPGIGSLYNMRILYLEYNNFSGPIHSAIFNISSLQEVDISDNRFSGFTPTTFLNNMSSLQVLDLGKNNLTGHLPPNMFAHLPVLRKLYLSRNLFYGSIPSTLSACKRLQVLSLSVNHFQGGLHMDFGNLTLLEKLYLGFNNFTGTKIPMSIGNLVNLKILSIPRSSLTGKIPPSIGNLTQLRLLDLTENNLKGSVPSEVGNFAYLEMMKLGINSLNGVIPSGIFNSSKLVVLEAPINLLSGNLPPSFGLHLPNLEHFLIGRNNFDGPIPISLVNASKLIQIDMSENLFHGSVPDAFGNLRNLRNLNLAENHLTIQPSSSGLSSFFSSLTNCNFLTSLRLSDNLFNTALPNSVGNLSFFLQEFITSGCAIAGTLPNEIGNLSSLILLVLDRNDLQGTIPMTIGKLRNLQGLSLEYNRIQTIPSAICELQALAYLHVGINELSGAIPSCVGNLTSLRSLSIETNRFNSTIPSTLWSLEDILEMDLSSNFLSGSLPPDIGNLKAVTFFDLSKNQLSGRIPPSFGDLKDLINLSLSTNRLERSIPQSLGDAISLQFLDLSNNSLSGEIPKSLEKLRYLVNLNVSFNQLQGEIPTGGPFNNLSAQSFLGNKELCGMPKMQVRPCKIIRSNQSKKLVIVLLVIGTLVSALAIIFLIWCCRRKTMPIQQGHLLPLASWERISIHELKRATDNFNEMNLLGKGSFGSVYKGTLSDGTSVAIKVYDLQLEGAFKSFEVECEVVRRIRHRNLVKIITSCCITEFKALVLEFMPSWSLEKWLYSDNYFLDMLQRLNIMIDVASALEYLHYGCAEPIVHCDLKPSNVLLDEDMVAHVSDFGIAKLLSEDQSVIQTMTLATVGYMAPEYGSEGLVSIKGDMYSYGILMMETFMSRTPTDEMFNEEMSMKQWARESLPHGVTELADPKLLPFNDPHYSAKTECILSVMELALKCCADLPDERLIVKDVLNALNKIKVKFLNDVQ